MSVLLCAAPFPGVLTSLNELRGMVPDRGDMASISQMLGEHVHTPGVTLAAIDQALENSYRNTRY